MGILEACTPSQSDDQLAEPKLPLAEAKRLITDGLLAKLMQSVRSQEYLKHELAREGIFVWLAGDDKDILGIHAKKEQGRDYEAFLLATLEPGGTQVDMSFQNGETAWSLSIDPGDEPPDQLVALAGDISTIDEAATARAARARAANWYATRTTHPAYITNQGPGRAPQA